MSNALETPRLILRSWQESDHIPFAHLNADLNVMAFFPSTLTRDASNQMSDRCQILIDEKGFGFWAVELKHTVCIVFPNEYGH